MSALVDVQYASNEPDLPDKDMLTHWVNAALQSALQCQIPPNKKGRKGEEHHSPFSPVPLPLVPSNVELTIRIVDEAEARQLNERWRQRKGPTNVLSFPFEGAEGIDIPLLGDLVICAPLVEREAAEQQKSRNAHWAHLVIHGTLHLLGYDHIDEQKAQVMESLEIRVLHDLGYPNPYHTHQEPL